MHSLLRSRSLADRTASRHDHCAGRNHHLAVLVSPDIFSGSSIEDRCRRIDDHACTDHRILLDDGALIDAAVSADEHIVLDDDRKSPYRLEHSTKLRCSRKMHVLSHLRA